MGKTTFTLKRKQFGFVGNMFGMNNFRNLKALPGTTAMNLKTHQPIKTNAAGKELTGWYKAGQIGLGSAKFLGSTALAVGGLAAGTGMLAKKGIEKAGEQSDGSKMFSQNNKNDMATTYTLKRKTFSDDGQQEKKSNAGKIALGVGATAAGLFAGARRGLMGTGAMKATNSLWAKTGNAIGSRRMVQSGAKKYGAAVVKESGAKLEGRALNREIVNQKNKFLRENNMLQNNNTKKAASTKPPQPKQKVNPESIMDVGYEG